MRTILPLVLLLAPTAAAQAPDGTMWATNFSGTAFQSVSRIDIRGEVLGSTTVPGFGPFALAVDPMGNLWAGSNGTLVGKYDRNGVSLGTFPVGSFPQSVASDSLGSVWVSNRSSNSVMKLDNAGNQLFTVPLPSGTSPIGVIVDALNRVWVSGFHSNTSTTHTLTVLDSLGTVLNTYSYTPPVAGFGFSFPAAGLIGDLWVANQAFNALLHIDGFTGAALSTTPVGGGLARGCAVDGLGHVWIASQGFAGSCHKVDGSGTIVATFLPPSTSFTTVSIDGNGDPWVFGFSSGKAIKLWQVDATELVQVPLPSGGSAWGGDSGGFHLARNLLPAANFDGDGFTNGAEVAAGTNPFDVRCTPAQPLMIQSGIPVPGTTVQLGMRLRPDAGLGYVVGLSFTNGPTVLPDNRLVPLGLPIFLHAVGGLDQNGDARTSLVIPNIPGISGISVFAVYATLDPAASLGVRTISNDLQITVR